MFNPKEFINSLIDINVKNDILIKNEQEFYLASELLDFAENELIPEISSPFHNIENGQITINNTVLLLLVQALKSYRSSLLLCMDGYYTTSVIVTRNILDIVFNTKYIIEESPEERISRADDYVNNLSKWTSAPIRNRAYLSYSSILYAVYSESSDFTHANSKATMKNINKDGGLSFLPTSENIEESLTQINTVFYYLIELLCGYYRISLDNLNRIEKTIQFEKKYRTYKMFNFSKRYYDDN